MHTRHPKNDALPASHLVTQAIQEAQLPNVGRASIRELVALVNRLEALTQQPYIRMEMGVPGLDAPSIGIEAEIRALHDGVASKYPMLEGIPTLKEEMARFCQSFLNLSVPASTCFVTVGSAQGALATFLVANRTKADGGTLFIDPGFPNQKRQLDLIGQPWGSFDVYAHRGEKLEAELERHLSTGRYTTLLYSNPNNPAWICFDDQELQAIAKVADRYGVIVIEDLAYFGMDYREDYSQPNQAPYQPTSAHYTDNFVLLISSSKVFSYAGQRVASLIVSEALYNRDYPSLKTHFGQTHFGKALLFGALHGLSSGVTHSAQYGLAAMLKAANDGTLPFLNTVQVYQERAKTIKALFIKYGFSLVYDHDNGQPLSDGFYFTFSYPNLTGETLLEELLYVGISALSLSNTGSTRSEGLRACVSQIHPDQFPLLEQRLAAFQHTHPITNA